MAVVAVVQARSGSERLPGKVLSDLGGRPVLSWVVRAAQQSRLVDSVVVATTEAPEDDAVARIAALAGAAVVRGPRDDVLTRYVTAARAHQADAVVRLTSDCPLLDPRLIDAVVAVWSADPGIDYVSTTLHRTLPRGLDVELITRGALLALDSTATGHHRSHVTSAVHEEGAGFSRLGVVVAPAADDLRVTLDVEEDAHLLRGVVEALGDRAPAWAEVVALLRARPDLVRLNAHVEQKPVEAG